MPTSRNLHMAQRIEDEVEFEENPDEHGKRTVSGGTIPGLINLLLAPASPRTGTYIIYIYTAPYTFFVTIAC